MSAPGSRIAIAKAVVTTIVALDLFVLVGLSFHTTSTTTTTVAAPATIAAPGAVAPPAGEIPAGDVPATGGATLDDAAVLADTTQDVIDADPTPTPAAATPTAAATPGAPTTSAPVPDDTEAGIRVASCPIDLPEPEESGGLQTLIGLAPAFGPLSDEAFSAAAAYQPLLQLLGPIIAKYPEIEPSLQPALGQLLGGFTQLLDSGWAFLGPLYSPYRPQILQAEADLAAALAPLARQLVESPLGGCVVGLQAALLNKS